jgi:peptidoglycan/LPS O-acetylase OafA/YrhL
MALLSKVPIAIVSGALIACVLHTRLGYEAMERWLPGRYAPVLLSILSLVALNAGFLPPFVVHLFFSLLVASCVMRQNHALSRPLSFAPLVYIGTVSYGMYLFHMLCKNAVVKALSILHPVSVDTLSIFPLTVALTLIVAATSFKYYESRFGLLKYRFER